MVDSLSGRKSYFFVDDRFPVKHDPSMAGGVDVSTCVNSKPTHYRPAEQVTLTNPPVLFCW